MKFKAEDDFIASLQVGAALCALRLEEKMSQKDVHLLSGLPMLIIQEMEKGHITLEQLYKYLNTLGYTADITLRKYGPDEFEESTPVNDT